MISVNGCCAGGMGGGECSVNGGDGERFLYNLSPTFFLKILTEGAVTKEAGISQPSPPAVALTLECLVGVPS